MEKLDSLMSSVKLEHMLTPHTKINSRWFKDLSIRHDTIKLLEEIIGKIFADMNHTSIFLGLTPKAIGGIKPKINKGDLIKSSSLYTAKGTINKRQPMNGRKYLQMM